jgi:hypothetical protein
VERDGEYEIALARWPFERDLPLSAPCPEKKMTVGVMPAGVALPIRVAQLVIADQQLTLKTRPEDKAAVFRVRLRGGTKTKLHGWFQDAEGKDLCGAYYVRVRRL